MSALTKIFIVLLVVLSLLLSAGLIVFVNRQDNFRVAAKKAVDDAKDARSDRNLLLADIQKVKNEMASMGNEHTNQVNALRADVSAREKDIADQAGQIAQVNQQLTQANATNVSLSEGLKVTQQDSAARLVAFNDQRAAYDKVQKEVVEDSNRISELTNSLEIRTKQARYMGEQNTQLTQTNSELSKLLSKYNISPTGSTGPAGGAINTTPNININGVVRDTRIINGVPYATISLGSAEMVTRGMKFNVVDSQKNQFLGYLTVDNVGSHESTGHMEGPSVNQVRPNTSEVRTQL